MTDIPVFSGGSVRAVAPPPTATKIPTFQPGKTLEEVRAEAPFDPQGGLVKAWSASALKKFETCKYATYLKSVKKCADPSGEAANRGTQIHSMAEDYINGTTKFNQMPAELRKFTGLMQDLREKHAEGVVVQEQNWGFDVNWNETGYFDKNIWLRAKLDVFLREDDTSARVIDWKTGKKFGNEIVHAGQGIIYTIATFKRYPELEHLSTEFVYLDHGETTVQRWTRKEAMRLAPRLNIRATKMTSCVSFPPSPGPSQCCSPASCSGGA